MDLVRPILPSRGAQHMAASRTARECFVPVRSTRGEETHWLRSVLRRNWCAGGVLGNVSIDLQPPVEAAGIRIGAARDEAREQCLAHGEPKLFRRSHEANASLVVERPSGLSIFVYFDVADVVEAIEFGRAEGNDVVLFRGIDIFGTPADTLVERLREITSVEVDEGGHSATAPDLLLALWRSVVPDNDNDPDGRYFESVLLARPGYYG